MQPRNDASNGVGNQRCESSRSGKIPVEMQLGVNLIKSAVERRGHFCLCHCSRVNLQH